MFFPAVMEEFPCFGELAYREPEVAGVLDRTSAGHDPVVVRADQSGRRDCLVTVRVEDRNSNGCEPCVPDLRTAFDHQSGIHPALPAPAEFAAPCLRESVILVRGISDAEQAPSAHIPQERFCEGAAERGDLLRRIAGRKGSGEQIESRILRVRRPVVRKDGLSPEQKHRRGEGPSRRDRHEILVRLAVPVPSDVGLRLLDLRPEDPVEHRPVRQLFQRTGGQVRGIVFHGRKKSEKRRFVFTDGTGGDGSPPVVEYPGLAFTGKSFGLVAASPFVAVVADAGDHPVGRDKSRPNPDFRLTDKGSAGEIAPPADELFCPFSNGYRFDLQTDRAVREGILPLPDEFMRFVPVPAHGIHKFIVHIVSE